jgi:hypothetical protein
MVDRPQQQHGVHGAVAEVQVARVTQRGVDVGRVGDRAELVNVERHEVAVLDPVATLGQSLRIAPRAAADIGDHRGWGRELAQHDLLGALELQDAARLGEAITLLAPGVVLVQGRVDGAVHEPPRWHTAPDP